VERLEQFVKAEVTSSSDIVRADLLTRILTLEDALKEADVERLSTTGGLRKDLDALRLEVQSSHDQAAKRTESDHASLRTQILSKLEDVISKQALAVDLERVSVSLSALEEKNSHLSALLTASEDRTGNSLAKLQEKMEEQHGQLQTHAAEKAESTLALVRSSEGAQIKDLADTLRRAGEDHRDLAEQVRQGLDALQKDMASARTSASERLEASVNAMAARIDPVQHSVAGLVQECQELCRSQETSENSLAHLEEAVRAMEARAGPIDDTQRRLLELEWYLAGSLGSAATRSACLSCSMPNPPAPGGTGSARERSASPGSARGYKVLHGVASRSGLPNAVGWGWGPGPASKAAGFSPQPPATPRPASAGGVAAGHALSAARVSRGTKTPANASSHQSSTTASSPLNPRSHSSSLQAEGKSVQQ